MAPKSDQGLRLIECYECSGIQALGSVRRDFPPGRVVATSERRWANFILATSDFVALFLSGLLAYTFWALPVRNQSPTLYLELLSLLPLFTLGYLQSGLYPGFGLGPVETLRRLSYVTGFGFLVLAAFAFALRLPHLHSRMTFAIAVALSLSSCRSDVPP